MLFSNENGQLSLIHNFAYQFHVKSLVEILQAIQFHARAEGGDSKGEGKSFEGEGDR